MTNAQRKTVLLFSTIMCSLTLFASPQAPDYIIYKKDTIPTYNLILEQYLQKKEVSESAKLFGLSFRDSTTFNCWRGYQAIYKIENDSLFLSDIIRCGERGSKIDRDFSLKKMKSIFAERISNGKVYIDWFTGDINFPLTKKLLRWDGVFYKIFEKETVINIANGKIIKEENVDNYTDKPGAINRKYKRELPKIIFKKLKKVKWKSIDDFDCSDKYLVTIGKDGRISKVMTGEYKTDVEIDARWKRDEYNYCVNTIYNALKKLKFDILKDKGKPITEDIFVEIWFDGVTGKIEDWTD